MKAYAQLLGVPKIRLAGVWHEPPLTKVNALLYHLAFKGDWCSRDELLFLFYADMPETVARNNLRQRLISAKRLPYSKGLEIEAARLRWPVETDVQAFKRAAQEGNYAKAVDLYQGQLLEGCSLADAPEFESWLEAERAALHSQWRDAVFALSEELEGSGRHPQACEVLERLYKTDPLDEEVLRRYLQALYLSGQRSRALDIFERFKKQLQEEFEGEPEDETLRLIEQIERSKRAQPGRSATPRFPRAAEDTQAQHNLPAQATPFVGREAERERLSQLLDDPSCRLLTIVGPGGMGKTRLGIEAAREKLNAFRDGVFFVSFVPVASPDLMVYAIGQAIGFSFFGQQEPKEQLFDYLKNKKLLLVLDNLEHLLSGVSLVSELLEHAPQVSVLATSRERLNLYAEQVFNLYGLSVPEAAEEEAQEHGAVKLFIQRAASARADFFLNDTNLPVIIRTCQLVRGLPLALELAASWLRALTLKDVAVEIEKGIDFLETSARDLPERHRSIRAVFDHSWKLLTDEEQAGLRRLSVCQGGFRREAAAEIAGAKLPVLASLVDKSFLTFTPTGRYRRHPLVIQYTQEKLTEQPEEKAQAEERHSLYYLRFMQERSKEVFTRKGKEAYVAIDEEYPNVKAAWSWIIRYQRLAELKTYTFVLEPFFMYRTPEGERLLADAVAALEASKPEHQVVLGYALVLQSQVLGNLQHYKEAHERAQRSLKLLLPTGDKQGIIYALGCLGSIYRILGDSMRAKPLLEEGLALSRLHPEFRRTGLFLLFLGLIERELGTLPQVKRFFENAIAEAEMLDELNMVAMLKNHYGLHLAQRAFLQEGETLIREGLKLLREIYDPRMEGYALIDLSEVTYNLGEYDEAEALAREAAALAEKQHMKNLTAIALTRLGRIALARGDHLEAFHYLTQSLQAVQATSFPEVIWPLVLRVELSIAQNKSLEAAMWLGLVQAQPSSGRIVGYEIDRLLEVLQEQLSEGELQEALERGRRLKLEEVVPELLH